MENTPHNTDTDAGPEKKDSKSKKKKVGELGAFVVEPQKPKEKSSKDMFESGTELEPSAPIDRLGEQEKHYAEREFTKAEQAADTEPIEAVERFRDRIIIEGQDSETALDETIAELEELPDAEDVAEVDDSPQEFNEDVVLLNEHANINNENDAEVGDEATEDAINGTSTAPTVSPNTGGSGRPPQGGPPVGIMPFGPGPFGNGGGTPGQNFNVTPTAPIAAAEEEYRRPNAAGAALVGGIIGYLIGRRRGRIKTEKRLLPVQKKLQKEVVNLQSQLQQKEAKIRKLAATKVQEKPKPIVEVAPAPVAIVNKVEKVVSPTPELTLQSERAPAPEANQLHGKRHAPEQIGHMLVVAESARKTQVVAENLQKTVEKQPAPPLSVERNIDTLNRVDLLKLSERIVIDGSSLRQIYETRLVGEKGLRRLVKEYLKGGDIKKALRHEIVEREIDFERDPGLRDRTPQAATPKGGGRAATLNDLLQNAAVGVEEDKEEVAFLKARSAYEEFEREKQSSKQHLIDISFVGIILMLLGLVVFLVITNQ